MPQQGRLAAAAAVPDPAPAADPDSRGPDTDAASRSDTDAFGGLRPLELFDMLRQRGVRVRRGRHGLRCRAAGGGVSRLHGLRSLLRWLQRVSNRVIPLPVSMMTGAGRR